MKSVSVKLTGAIIVQVGDTTSYHLALLKDYKSHNTSQSVFMRAMMVLDAKVYGYSKFKIEDTIALSNTKEVYFSINTTSSNTIKKGLLNTDDPCDIIEIWYNPDGDHCNCNGDEYNTGDWYYADEENCFSSTPQPVLWYFLGGSGELPDKYYTLPDFGEGNGGGGSNDPPYTPIPITETQKKNYLMEELNLNQTQEFYLVNTQDAIDKIFNYVYANNTVERRNLALWILNFIPQNQDVSIYELENWFFKQSEFTEGEIAILPNLITSDPSIVQVPLPALSDFESYFPKSGSAGNYSELPAPIVYQYVGGSLYQSFLNNPDYSNACAIRGSRGLLYAGIEIPVLTRTGIGQRTQKGGDNKNYILDAVTFDWYMKKQFGETSFTLIGADASNPQKVADLLKGKNGIYVIINNNSGARRDGGAGYSGHVDLILNGICVGAAYTTPQGGVKSIRIWVLN